MRYRHRTLLIVLALGPMVLASCRAEITRSNSSLIDDLTGVWTFPIESETKNSIADAATVIVVDGMTYTIYDYASGRYSKSRHGEVVGEEGVYFFQNEASFYSPKFFVENSERKILIWAQLAFRSIDCLGQKELR